MGVEIEFDRRVLSSKQYADRLSRYLSMVESRRVSDDLALYDGAGALGALPDSDLPALRMLYDRLTALLTKR